MTIKPTLYRPNIGIMVINDTGKVLVCQRADNVEGGKWQMPQGGIDENEDTIKAGLRELNEETGITADEIEIIDLWDEYHYYDFPIESVYNEYKGQKQKWLLVKYLKDDNSINLANAQDNEFLEYKWDLMANIVKDVWIVRKPIYKALENRYAQYLA
jgi:putative (di)nucleoside polyphosphate hydrolase